MNALEQRLADRFRENGDRMFAGLPDWPNTIVEVGDQPLRINAERLREDLRYPPVYRHHVRIPFDGLVRVQDLVGVEVLGDAVLVDAVVLADRDADGPVIGVKSVRHWYDKLGRHSFLLMRSPTGLPLFGRWSTVGNAQKGCIAEMRRNRRWWISSHEAMGFDPGKLLWDPKLGRPDGGVTHVVYHGGCPTPFCDGRDGEISTLRAGDGRWLAGRSNRLLAFQREYEEGEAVPVVEALDPDDAFLEGVFG